MDRPPADPAKLLEAWMEWERGEALPGRVMSNLKTGGLRDVLEHLAQQAAAVAAATDGTDAAEAPEVTEVSTESWTPVV